MKIYNTLTRQKEELQTIEPGKVRIYSCGPTVYNYIHIGNARPICVFDVLRRYLTYRGYEVKFVQNYTDVDDKIIRKANEEGVESKVISERFIQEYLTDAHGLNVLDADVHPKVTETMGDIIKSVKKLVENGYAYESQGDVYFRTLKFKEYGKLSHMPLDDLEAGARIEVSSIKEDPMDFALWKASKPGEPAWDSPWGKGRPGWHIECSAMACKFLGETIDIHCGGQDLIFPHHENEIAQSECANNVPFSHYWMHNGYINIDNKKMSKSAGNFFTTREISEKYGYEPIRFLMLQAHYRSQINYTTEILESCVSALERLYNCRENLAYAMKNAAHGTLDAEKKSVLDGYRQAFIAAMDDDLNTADAISAIFELVKTINLNKDGECVEYLAYAGNLFEELTGVLGLLYMKKEEQIPQEVLDLVEKRAAARAEKNWAEADALRDQIAAMGYVLEETRQGTKITKK
jgi:cysteinyl-tRNA synthetase